MEQIIQTFSESFKRSVVDQVNNGLISKEEARRHYGIKSKHGVIPAKAGTSSKFVNQNYQVQQQQLLNQQISKLFLCKGYTLVLIIRNAKLMAMIIFFFLLY
jgi:hypothetical protein